MQGGGGIGGGGFWEEEARKRRRLHQQVARKPLNIAPVQAQPVAQAAPARSLTQAVFGGPAGAVQQLQQGPAAPRQAAAVDMGAGVVQPPRITSEPYGPAQLGGPVLRGTGGAPYVFGQFCR